MTNEIKEIYEKAAEKRKKANFSTGFEDLDNFCKYLDGGDVMIIGGRPAMGKTNFAISLLNHLLSIDKNVLFFTPEQSKEQFVQRLLAEKMGVSIYNIKDNKINKNELIDTIDWFSDKKIYINDNSCLTTDDIETDIENIPSPELKRVQRLIMRKYFKPYWIPISVKDAASVHCGKKWLMKLDIKDFFNSISEEQIKDVIHHYAALYESPNQIRSREDSDVEQIFSMCTINGNLPTGAPTSPYIANLLLKEFDLHMEYYCKSCDVYYSRYMDDLFFSTYGPQYLLSLVELEVLRQFKEMGFGVNVEKIKYISSNKRQQVLGLGVNNKQPVLTKDDKRKYRAYFYNMLYPIQFNKQKAYKEHELEVLGHLAYIKSVDEDYYIKILKYIHCLINRLDIKQRHCLKKLIK